MKPFILLLSLALISGSCVKSNLEVLLKTLEEETLESTIDFVSLNCKETLSLMEMRYMEFPQRVEAVREDAQIVVRAVEEFKGMVDNVRDKEANGGISLEELIKKYEASLKILEEQVPEGWEEMYTETSRDYYLKSYSKTQLKRIALLMYNDVVLNEAFVLKSLYYSVDWSD